MSPRGTQIFGTDIPAELIILNPKRTPWKRLGLVISKNNDIYMLIIELRHEEIRITLKVMTTTGWLPKSAKNFTHFSISLHLAISLEIFEISLLNSFITKITRSSSKILKPLKRYLFVVRRYRTVSRITNAHDWSCKLRQCNQSFAQFSRHFQIKTRQHCSVFERELSPLSESSWFI